MFMLTIEALINFFKPVDLGFLITIYIQLFGFIVSYRALEVHCLIIASCLRVDCVHEKGVQ